MEFIGKIQPIVALIAGVLILVKPSLLNLIVAVYLIYIGLYGIAHSGMI
ncbi:MAG: DUF3096 domain-containing protein [Azospirillum sp.]|nr:DUF3096 domain-containing protein [Azospirillum sp.]